MDGPQAEGLARAYLEARGLRWVTGNFRTRRGEIDLIMTDAEQLVFVEVRARVPSRFGTAADTITAAKIRRISAAANAYLQSRRLYNTAHCRFDVIAIEAASDQEPRIRWIRNAFSS